MTTYMAVRELTARLKPVVPSWARNCVECHNRSLMHVNVHARHVSQFPLAPASHLAPSMMWTLGVAWRLGGCLSSVLRITARTYLCHGYCLTPHCSYKGDKPGWGCHVNANGGACARYM